MERDPVLTLLGLGVVLVFAVGAAVLLLRASGRAVIHRSGVIQGYPASRYPAQALTHAGPLAALAATQARLLSIYEQVPAQSELAVWLRPFLVELRAIMDTAYRVTVITHIYEKTAPLDRLVAEVQQIEAQLADHAVQQLLARDADAQHELLDGRIETLRLCVRELATVTEMQLLHGAG
jgi:hypothetical protein